MQQEQDTFPDVSSSLPGQICGIVHKIPITADSVVWAPCRPILLALKNVIKRWRLRYRWGVIEKSTSPWQRLPVLFLKPNGSMQFCINFWWLNTVSAVDAYPMPQVDTLLNRLGQARYLFTLDLMKGYWQILLVPVDRENMVFPISKRLFRSLKCPLRCMGQPQLSRGLWTRSSCRYGTAH